MGMAEDLQRNGQMPPGLLSPLGPSPPNPMAQYLGDEDLAKQIARDQGVPMDVARYMLQAPSYTEGRGMDNRPQYPYPYAGQAQEAPAGSPIERELNLRKQLDVQPPAYQQIGDVLPFGGAGSVAPPGTAGGGLMDDVMSILRGGGRSDWFGPLGYPDYPTRSYPVIKRMGPQQAT